MNYVRILGGLGNQMFQYAFGLSLKNENKDVLFDVSDFQYRQMHNGFELVRVFSISRDEFISFNGDKINSKIKKILIKKTGGQYKNYFIQPDAYKFYSNVYTLDNFYFDGYWQNLDYIKNTNTNLENIFKFRNLENSYNAKINDILSEIQVTESVAIHIRGGDYIKKLKTSFVHAVVGIDYYEKAIVEILKRVTNPVFFIFTNDTEYAKRVINNINRKLHLNKTNVKFVPENKLENNWIDMYLMSKCKHMIITNSSFSWWAGYLNSNHGLVLMPPKWTRFHRTDKINLRKNDNWKIIY